jgi:hypothetical protein
VGGDGAICCACKAGPNSKATQSKTRVRFMSGKTEKSNEATENQDWNLHLEKTFGHN